jgi:kinesin family protein 3/17
MNKPADNVKVVIRCRPLSKNEMEHGNKRIVEMDSTLGSVSLKKPDTDEPARTFTFDSVYDWK